MMKAFPRIVTAGLFGIVTTACATASRSSSAGVQPITMGADGRATVVTTVNTAPIPHTAADVEFMTGMIPHHAQAVLISRWAESHGARKDVAVLAARIAVGQLDEIGLMQAWLHERNLPVPPADATHHKMNMNGMVHEMLMPGMLTDEELKRLDAARGPAWDRLFLTYMIRHHEGALIMVDKLYESPGSAQDEAVFRFSADVQADQSTEIERMQQMLAATPGGRLP